MRSENELWGHLKWLEAQCPNFKDEEAIPVMRQLETLLWVLGHERDEAQALAETLWNDSRNVRRQNPQDYS